MTMTMEESVKRLLTLAFLTILLVGSTLATESSGMSLHENRRDR